MIKQIFLFLFLASIIGLIGCNKDPQPPSLNGNYTNSHIEYTLNNKDFIFYGPFFDSTFLPSGKYSLQENVVVYKTAKGTILQNGYTQPYTVFQLTASGIEANQGVLMNSLGIISFTIVTDSLSIGNYHYDSTNCSKLGLSYSQSFVDFNLLSNAIVFSSDYIDFNITSISGNLISGNFTAKLTLANSHSAVPNMFDYSKRGESIIQNGKFQNILIK